MILCAAQGGVNKLKRNEQKYALLYLRPDSTTVPLVDAKLSGPT